MKATVKTAPVCGSAGRSAGNNSIRQAGYWSAIAFGEIPARNRASILRNANMSCCRPAAARELSEAEARPAMTVTTVAMAITIATNVSVKAYPW